MKKFVYQIYPASFKDSGSKGFGDLKGIIDKLSYLKELGVEYIWITPFFVSPFKDNGYDVSDYLNVDPKFGTNADLALLIKSAKEKGINIMLDMVFNHTSTDHAWFKGWLSGDPMYQDFYISRHSASKPPTNWVSKFGGPAWKEYKKNEWYLHLFNESQADLNWDNPAVRNEIKKIIHYYISLGVKGFRFDVINLISKGEYKDDVDGDGRKFYTDGPKVHQYLAELREEFPKDDSDFLTIGELSSTSIENTIMYANENKSELDSVFTFHHLKVDYNGLEKFTDLDPDISKLNSIFSEWYPKVTDAGATMANFLTCHDQPRAVSRFIKKEHRVAGAKMLFALTAALPGPTYIFQGEEIGMENTLFNSREDFRDVESINFLKTIPGDDIPVGLLKKSRDNARSPMQWDNSLNAGFSHGKPWINVNPNYKDINVELQLTQNNSIINFYKEFIKFAKESIVINEGKIKFNEFKNNIISFDRVMKDKKIRCSYSFNSDIVEYQYNKEKVIKTNYNNYDRHSLKPYQFIIEEL